MPLTLCRRLLRRRLLCLVTMPGDDEGAAPGTTPARPFLRRTIRQAKIRYTTP
ncbi:hypothetical protein ABZ208_10995 [Streptomyces sp. NPDC006208]|uniref:hypothetical protein n=1 Tax=Streptomyces sp. NPDC006208 TaxID=3156734 RepID=UPI0033A66C3E